jgi:hypothetical protein
MNDDQRSTQDFVGTAERENITQLEQTAPRKTEESLPEQWLGSAEIDELKSRWNLIQGEFVDEPHTAVEQAKTLVAEMVDKVERKLSEQQSSLNESIDGHEEISTEDLRIALQRYRSFFNRLLTL